MKIKRTALLFLFASILQADSPASSSRGELAFYLDTASFRSSLGNVYQEFYYQIALDQLSFEQQGDQQVDSLLVRLHLTSKTDEHIYNDSWTTPIVAALHKQTSGMVVPDQIDLLCEPGDYKASLQILESSTGRQGTAQILFHAPDFSNPAFQASSIELASEVTRDSSGSKFTKNGLKLLPNASRIFGGTLPMLIYYFEIYNALPLDLPGNEYTIEQTIMSSTGDTVRALPAKTKSHQGKISVEVNAISTAGLVDSSYVLAVRITDNHSREIIDKHIAFKKFVPISSPELGSPVAGIISKFNQKELALHLRQVKCILSKQEIDLLSQLDENGQKKALVDFWDRLDPNPATPANEYWDNFINRIQIANARYSTGYTEGWNSDRGRILIKYGVPDDIERNPLTLDSKPYEVWSYYREKGYRFIFVDEEGFGNYRFIYSNHQDEPSDPRYQDILKVR